MTTRRNFIAGSAAAAASLAAPVHAAAVDRTAWEAAEQRMREADAAYNAYHRDVVQPIEDALEERLRSNGITQGQPHYDERRREVVAQAHDFHAAHTELERLCEVLCESEQALLNMPAPDASALRWKLDRILEPCHGGTTSWDWSYVAQAVEDYRRILS